MKVLSAANIREADQYTIQQEPILSIDLMERAARSLLHWIRERYNRDTEFYIFCGSGNNGGDGLALARMLWSYGYTVHVNLVKYAKGKGSEDFKDNLSRLPSGLPTKELNELKDLPSQLSPTAVIIDAIFGSGLNRPVEGFYKDVIAYLNALENDILAIDIPSGLFADRLTQSTMVHADHTLTFQMPKWSFFLPEHAMAIGEFHILDIKLSQDFIEGAATNFYYQTFAEVKWLFKPRTLFMHKGQAGRALLVAGGKGKMGAAVLAAKACLRSGAGLLTIHIPHCGYDILQSEVPEAMTTISAVEDIIGDLPDLSSFDVIGVGPGIGTEQRTHKVLHELLLADKQLVIDADALNILAQDASLWPLLEGKAILTPHPGELSRLVGESNDSAAALEKAREFCEKWKVVMVLKGAYSRIIALDGRVWFNSTGNPGMATGGSGDMLTGILVALVGQGYPLLEVARLGTFVHGLAADIAVQKLGYTGYIPSDGIAWLPGAFKMLEETKTN